MGNEIDIDDTNNMLEGHSNTNDYYMYYRLQNATFGSFYVVIVFPYDVVYAELNLGRYLVIFFTALAIIFAILNGCIVTAVPLIPSDDSWLAVPLFTEQDKKELNDNMEIGAQIANNKKRRTANIESPKIPP